MNGNKVATAQNFGEFFRSKRIALGFTLRSFCERYNYDPGNISRLERNILSPSLDSEKLTGYATALKLPRDSEDWVIFHDLAHAAKSHIPEDILTKSNATKYLPLLFRTVRGKKMSKKQLEALIKLINQ